MKLRKTATALALAMSIPLFIQNGAQAQTTTVAAPGSQVEAAEDRLEKAKVRLDIAKRQVEAAKARLKAAEAEHRAAIAHHDAKQLEHKATEMSDESGLPAISDTMIDNGRRNSKIATVLKIDRKATENQKKNGGATAGSLNSPALNQVDFNAQPPRQAAPTPDEAQRLKNQSLNFNQGGPNLRPTLTAAAPAVIPTSTLAAAQTQGALEPPQIVP